MTHTISDESLLAEIEYLIRQMPPSSQLLSEDENTLEWCGRARAVSGLLDAQYRFHLQLAIDNLHGQATLLQDPIGVRKLLMAARHHLRMRTVGPLSLAVGSGMVFQYFDSLSDIIKEAKSDILFVDPFLDKEFVSKYLGFVGNSTRVRLLSRKYINTLVPSVEQYVAQHGLAVEVRSSNDLHDRYVFIDGSSCYQSGASFKDGGIKPTVLTQIVDPFPAVLKTYEDLWQGSNIKYPIP
ncbi:hypothetical protein [Mesorhizobium sp.]|uniref:hypothetical protein n=1 Tax=Mesorhizobium sp. TaxID=1871066 RepID=UPI00121CB349|nr:hypothetical protein [Mesorhizobium sp.]TIL31362.1 MAG: hypothetical protein E5Y82_30300 [Mesorhizobium sp.]